MTAYFKTVKNDDVLKASRLLATQVERVSGTVKVLSNLVMASLMQGQNLDFIKNDAKSVIGKALPKETRQACSGADIILKRLVDGETVPTNAKMDEFLTLADLKKATEKFDYNFDTLRKYAKAWDAEQDKQKLADAVSDGEAEPETDAEPETEQSDIEKLVIMQSVIRDMIADDVELVENFVADVQAMIEAYHAEQAELASEAEQAIKTA